MIIDDFLGGGFGGDFFLGEFLEGGEEEFLHFFLGFVVGVFDDGGVDVEGGEFFFVGGWNGHVGEVVYGGLEGFFCSYVEVLVFEIVFVEI